MHLFVHLGHVSISLRGPKCNVCIDICVAKRCVFVGSPYIGRNGT